MLLQTNSYIVPRERRAEHLRLLRRFRQTLARLGCEHFEVYEQVGYNWSKSDSTGRYVQIMRFRDRKHQLAVQSAERSDPGAQAVIAEFCELINFPYQQQQGLFAVGFYNSVLPVAPLRAQAAAVAGEAEAAEEEAPGVEPVAQDPLTGETIIAEGEALDEQNAFMGSGSSEEMAHDQHDAEAEHEEAESSQHDSGPHTTAEEPEHNHGLVGAPGAQAIDEGGIEIIYEELPPESEQQTADDVAGANLSRAADQVTRANSDDIHAGEQGALQPERYDSSSSNGKKNGNAAKREASEHDASSHDASEHELEHLDDTEADHAEMDHSEADDLAPGVSHPEANRGRR